MTTESKGENGEEINEKELESVVQEMAALEQGRLQGSPSEVLAIERSMAEKLRKSLSTPLLKLQKATAFKEEANKHFEAKHYSVALKGYLAALWLIRKDEIPFPAALVSTGPAPQGIAETLDIAIEERAALPVGDVNDLEETLKCQLLSNASACSLQLTDYESAQALAHEAYVRRPSAKTALRFAKALEAQNEFRQAEAILYPFNDNAVVLREITSLRQRRDVAKAQYGQLFSSKREDQSTVNSNKKIAPLTQNVASPASSRGGENNEKNIEEEEEEEEENHSQQQQQQQQQQQHNEEKTTSTTSTKKKKKRHRSKKKPLYPESEQRARRAEARAEADQQNAIPKTIELGSMNEEDRQAAIDDISQAQDRSERQAMALSRISMSDAQTLNKMRQEGAMQSELARFYAKARETEAERVGALMTNEEKLQFKQIADTPGVTNEQLDICFDSIRQAVDARSASTPPSTTPGTNYTHESKQVTTDNTLPPATIEKSTEAPASSFMTLALRHVLGFYMYPMRPGRQQTARR